MSSRDVPKQTDKAAAASSKASNPFVKEDSLRFGRDDGDCGKLCRIVAKRAAKFFENNIPNDTIKDFPRTPKYVFGSLVYALAISLFVWLFYLNFQQARYAEYLAPLVRGEPLSNSIRDCHYVYKPFSGTYLASFDGFWEGHEGFDYSKALYQTTFNSFVRTDVGGHRVNFTYLFYEVSGALDVISSKITGVNDVAHNLLYLSMKSFAPSTPDTNGNQVNQIFKFTVAPSVILNQDNSLAGISNGNGACSVIPSTVFNAASATWTISWPYDQYMNDPNCKALLNPSMLQVSPNNSRSSFTLALDARSLFAASAANWPGLPNSSYPSLAGPGGYAKTQLSTVANYPVTSFSIGVTETNKVVQPQGLAQRYNITQRYDPNYPGMPLLTCLDPFDNKDNYDTVCLVHVGNGLFGVPVFNHFGYYDSGDEPGQSTPDKPPTYCSCPTPKNATHQENKGDIYFGCQGLNFLSAIIFFPSDLEAGQKFPENDTGILPALAYFLDHHFFPNPVDNSLDKKAYEATMYTPFNKRFGNFIETNYELFQFDITKEKRQQVFDFCSTPYGNCSVLAVHSYTDATFSTTSISPYYYQLINGGCSTNVVKQSDAALESLGANPPQIVTEDYLNCTATYSQAFNQALGLSMATTTTYVTLGVLILMTLLIISQTLFGFPTIPITYSKEERDSALKYMAIQALLTRDRLDKKSKERSALKSPFKALVQEIEEQGDDVHLVPSGESEVSFTINWNELCKSCCGRRKGKSKDQSAKRSEMVVQAATTSLNKLHEKTIRVLNEGSSKNRASTKPLQAFAACNLLVRLIEDMDIAASNDDKFWSAVASTAALQDVSVFWIEDSIRLELTNVVNPNDPKHSFHGSVRDSDDYDDDEAELRSSRAVLDLQQTIQFLTLLRKLIRTHIAQMHQISMLEVERDHDRTAGYALYSNVVVTIDACTRALARANATPISRNFGGASNALNDDCL